MAILMVRCNRRRTSLPQISCRPSQATGEERSQHSMAVEVSNAFLLVASWVNTMFYMLEILLAIRYFQRPNRPGWHKLGVATFILADTVSTIGICAQVYLTILTFPCTNVSTGAFIPSLFWPISVTILGTYTTASVEQAFLCYLFYSLTRQRWITGFFVLTIFFHLGTSFASAGIILSPDRGAAYITTKIGAIGCAATDILIGGALGVTFSRMEGFVLKGRPTQSVVRRLLVLSVTSGILVASVTLISVALLFSGIPAYSIFFFLQGRTYAITVLTNFLLGLPANDGPALTEIDSTPTRRTATNPTEVVFHLDYRRTSSNHTRPESLNLQVLADIHGKSSPD
ncbi:hypothetical protein C8F04DRAFT_1119405 [Mycena alexandri]|uniref:DUF6534 domain-containing protein n=1 Tax=Mycena alexandri TaxID=1745969 RepID=A0AAD6X163_9AGAR|nr:hypothetical protein C8F04DRAFT_1119405 [Mycena alexandri]